MRYRKSTLLIGVMMIAVLLVGIGCDEGKNMIGDVVGPIDKPTDKPDDLTMNGEVKQPDPGDSKDTKDPKEPTITVGSAMQQDDGSITVSGTSTDMSAKTVVTVTVGDITKTTKTDESGNWAVTIPAKKAERLAAGEVTVSVTAVGATGTGSLVIAEPEPEPTIAIDAVVQEDDGSVMVNGATTDVPEDTVVTVTLGDVITVETTTDEMGGWSVIVPAEEAMMLPAGLVAVTAVTAGVTDDVSFDYVPPQEPEPVVLTPEPEYGVTHQYLDGFPSSDILPFSAWVLDFPGPYVLHSRPVGGPNDFIGRVLMPIGGGDAINWFSDGYSAPVSNAIVTITDGPRAGEQVRTNKGGYYHFKDVEGDLLHLRVERQWLEPKEVVAGRCCGTTLRHFRENHVFFLRDTNPEMAPGTILMGLRWPDVLRPILENESLPQDLLIAAFNATEEHWWTESYGGGVITNHYTFPYYAEPLVELSYGTLAHELARARQGVDTLLHGIDESRWGETPQGRAYEAAWRKDMRTAHPQQDRMEFDKLYEHDLHNNAAAFCSLYWLQDGMQTKAPNRYKWAQAHLNAHPE